MRFQLLVIGFLLLLQPLRGGRYKDPTFSVKILHDIPFAEAEGYWSEMEDQTPTAKKIFMMNEAYKEKPLDLFLDLYLPQGDTLKHRPLVMLMHGGSFYYGTRKDTAISQWCRHLASLGYVAASIDYRLGFLLTKSDIERAGYRAVQDAHAAMRYLAAHQQQYGIDTSLMFVGGTSAGAITALNLTFMTNETRPSTSYASWSGGDLGNIETCGNSLTTRFSIKGVLDMWGGLADTAMMQGHNVPILAFQGDQDDVVPYQHDYPLGKFGEIKKTLANKMFGSSCIVDYAKRHGQKAELYTFKGFKHAPHFDPKTKKLNQNFYIIQDKMVAFLYQTIESKQAKKPTKALWTKKNYVPTSRP